MKQTDEHTLRFLVEMDEEDLSQKPFDDGAFDERARLSVAEESCDGPGHQVAIPPLIGLETIPVSPY